VLAARPVREIQRRLAQVFGTHTWRPDPALGPLEEVVGAIISQHTSGTNSRRAYERLRARYPTWEAVREAPLEGIQEAIRCAGLARLKAPRLKALLAQITAERGALDLGFLEGLSPPEAMTWLRRLPGVGQTTAACVLLFGMGRPVMPVDGGIQRVSRRLGLIAPRGSADEVQRVLEGGVEPGEVYSLHLNLIRFGRDLCTPAAPACPVCPLNDLCAHFRGQLPQPEPRAYTARPKEKGD
jgi:endonuclease III